MKDEEKLKLLPTNSEDYESIYKLLGSILCEHGEPSHYLGYLESLYKAAKKSRSAEKLVPLDESEVLTCLKRELDSWNFGKDCNLRKISQAIAARFASVPVVPNVVWPDELKENVWPSLEHYKAKAYNRGRADAIAAFEEAAKKSKT